jgi:hypothetical protein
MKLTILIAAALLAGCGKFNDMFNTGMDGYTMRCIDGTRYILMSSDSGLAITPHLGTDGKPKECK